MTPLQQLEQKLSDTVDELARALGMSRTQVVRRCRRVLDDLVGDRRTEPPTRPRAPRVHTAARSRS